MQFISVAFKLFRSPQTYVSLVFLFCSGNLAAQSPDNQAAPESVHWAFSSLVGTGWYRATSGRRAFILNVDPKQELRASRFEPSGLRQTGISINYDFSVGLYSVDDLPEIIDPENVSTASFTPGVEFEIPMSEQWYLRPFVHLGWGTSFDEDESAWIWYGGVKSRYTIDRDSHRWALLGGLYYAGYSPAHGRSNDLTSVYAGIELSHIAGTWELAGQPMRVHWQLGYNHLSDPAAFILQDNTVKTIGSTLEIGVSLSRNDEAFRLWFLEFDRLGINYGFNSDRTFKAVTLVTRAWFSK